MIELTDGQQRGLELALRIAKEPRSVGVICGYAGCHRAGQLILMFDGTVKKVEDIIPGDQLMGPGSTPRNVLGLLSGFGEMAQINPVKGNPWVVNIDHILTVELREPYKHLNPGRIDVSVRDWLSWPKTKRESSLLVRDAADWDPKELSVPPYILGLWLGDGASRGPHITTMDEEISEAWIAWGDTLGLSSKFYAGSLAYDVRLTTRTHRGGRYGHLNEAANALRKLGVLNNKHIPRQYMTGCRAQRLELIAGLLDTDGSLNQSGGFDYISIKEELANGLAFIARSLGLAAYVSRCNKSDQNGAVGIYHRVYVSGEISEIPCRLERKRAFPRKQKKRVNVTGFSVRLLSTPERYHGFEIDGDNRYLLGDFTVTHNTGKTTLIKTIIEQFQSPPVLLSPTGKAAARITEVTGAGAGTIHRWLYKAETGNAGLVHFTRKRIDEVHRPTCGLIIVDEASMLSDEVWSDLLNTVDTMGCSILLVGDGFQLPPIQEKGAKPFSVLAPGFVAAERRVELTEILRQALDSPIIRVTMAIREGDIHEALMDLDPVLPDELDAELVRADMVVCRTNKVRHGLNRRCRELRGYNGEAQVGEPLLVLKNNYTLDVYNGELHTFNGFIDNLGTQSAYDFVTSMNVPVNFQTTPMAKGIAILAPKCLNGELDQLSPSSLEKAVKHWQKVGRAFYVHANYGYALTCHKAQGSEADYVLVGMEPRFNYAGEEGRRWLYTALSRARKRVAITHLG